MLEETPPAHTTHTYWYGDGWYRNPVTLYVINHDSCRAQNRGKWEMGAWSNSLVLARRSIMREGCCEGSSMWLGMEMWAHTVPILRAGKPVMVPLARQAAVDAAQVAPAAGARHGDWNWNWNARLGSRF